VDHLWFTHFGMANLMSTASRETLDPNHPARRYLAIFTWGTPSVNHGAVHQLAGAKAVLHRMTPFKDFGVVSQAATDLVGSLESYFDVFEGDKVGELDPLLQASPFYQDGADFFKVVAKFADGFFEVFKPRWCTGEHLTDPQLVHFVDYMAASLGEVRKETTKEQMEWLGLVAPNPTSPSTRYTCKGFNKLLRVLTFTVTGWHRHVGTVSHLMRDPELTSASWIEGQRSGAPRQVMLMALIVATTGFTNPKLGQNNFGFMFEGLARSPHADTRAEFQVKELSAELERSMRELSRVVDGRNEQRTFPYLQMHPNYVENSVAV